MVRVRLFLVATPELAGRLVERFDRSGIRARLLEPAMLRGERGEPLFEGRHAGIVCQVASDEHAARIDEAYRAFGVDALVLERTLSGTLAGPDGRLVVVFWSIDAMQASLVRNLLVEEGIDAVVTGDSLAGGTLGINGPAVTACVMVAERDAEAAQQLIAELQQTRVVDAQEDEYQPPAQSEDGEAWPICPDCRRRRTTICPICDTAGSEFPRADANYAAVAAQMNRPRPGLAVICTTCDEPWSPDFLRRCEWCGHDFGEGLDGEQVEPPTLPIEHDAADSRVATVCVALLAVCALFAAYFAFLVRS